MCLHLVVLDTCRVWSCQMQHLFTHMAWCCYCCSLSPQFLVCNLDLVSKMELRLRHIGVFFFFWFHHLSCVFLSSNGCFSEWLRRSEKKNSSVPCPQCRADVHSVGRNHFLHNIEEVNACYCLPLLMLFINMDCHLTFIADNSLFIESNDIDFCCTSLFSCLLTRLSNN